MRTPVKLVPAICQSQLRTILGFSRLTSGSISERHELCTVFDQAVRHSQKPLRFRKAPHEMCIKGLSLEKTAGYYFKPMPTKKFSADLSLLALGLKGLTTLKDSLNNFTNWL